jgi:hypothetical protein
MINLVIFKHFEIPPNFLSPLSLALKYGARLRMRSSRRSFAACPAVILEEAKRPKNLQGTALDDDSGCRKVAKQLCGIFNC